MKNITTQCNKNYVKDDILEVKCKTNSRKNPCKLSPTISGHLMTDLNRPYIIVKNIYSKRTLDQAVNVCSIAKQPGLNIFVRLLYETIKENINFKIECPLKKVLKFLEFS